MLAWMLQAFKRGRICFLAFFVLATQGCMWSAHNFLTDVQVVGGLNPHDLGQDAINAGEPGSYQPLQGPTAMQAFAVPRAIVSNIGHLRPQEPSS